MAQWREDRVGPDPGWQPIAALLTGKLKKGNNELIIRVPRNGATEAAGAADTRVGKLYGPVFITASEPKLYPYLGEHGNARYVDLRMWQVTGNAVTHRTVLDLAMAIDPDHPFNLSGSAVIMTEQVTDMAEQYGATVQHTGREAWYHPWWAGFGLVGGFYGTSEESATATTSNLTRELGWILLDGDSNHNLFWDIEDYQKEEQKTGWFTRNKRAIQCFGKYLRVMPQVAIFRSGRNLTMGNQAPWNWDLGRGELQSIHIDNAYANETELLKGLTDACPVLLDSGSETMDEDVVQALYRYIEKGGTFIALHQTGRHSSIKQDAQPLSRLTGMTAAPRQAGKIRFAGDGAPVLAKWKDREVSGEGVSLTPASPDTVLPGEPPAAVARWDDGTVAIVVRRIGKGQVIQLGSSFWRKGLIEMGGAGSTQIDAAFLNQLLADVGVNRNADASHADIWSRKATSKNGLQQWLLTYNASESEHTADMRMALDQKPDEVWDLLTRAPVQSKFADGFITIPNVRFGPRETHLYAVRRAGLVEALPFWWGEKTKYWKRPPAASSAAVAAAKRWLETSADKPTADTDVIGFDRWRFLAQRDRSQDGPGAIEAWKQSGFDDSQWKLMDNGMWNLLDPSLSDFHGVGLYRARFTIPPIWKGRRVILNMYDWNNPIFCDSAEFFINGVKVGDYKAHMWSQSYAYDITSLLKDRGDNVLAARVQGGEQFSGIGGSIWIEPEQRFEKEIDFGGTWSLMKPDYRTETPAQLPGTHTGRCLKREFDLPPEMAGKTVYVHLETGNQWLGSIVINGKPIMRNAYMHPFSPRCEVNLTPQLVAGRNRIELWPYKTIPTLYPKDAVDEITMCVQTIRLGMVESR